MNDMSIIQSENNCLYYDFTKGDMEQQKHKLQQLQQRCQQQTLQQQQSTALKSKSNSKSKY